MVQELDVLESIQNRLHQKVVAAFEHLCTLQDNWQQLYADLDDKAMAQDIDSTCVDMKNTTATISMQRDPTRIKKGYGVTHIYCPMPH